MESLGINRGFWKNKKVLITGHTGFKGTWLSFWLSKMGATVKGLALEPSSEPNMYEAVIKPGDLVSTFGDIRDLELLKKEVKNFNPQIIMHLAAQAIVRKSYRDPIETFETNIMGTANILEAAKSATDIRAILCVTSDKCYENHEWPWRYRECDELGGWDPYSASKGCSELIVSSYKRSFFNSNLYEKHGVAVASARAGNVIGGGDWSTDRLIPDIMRSFSKEKPVIIRNPNAVRPWQYILDVLRGYIMLAEKLYEAGPPFAEAWNFGPSGANEKDVRHILQYLTERWGSGAYWQHDKQDNPHEAFMLKLDSSKARNQIGWNQILSLEQGLEFVLDWYKEFYSDRTSARATTEKQIAMFEQECRRKTSKDSSYNSGQIFKVKDKTEVRA